MLSKHYFFQTDPLTSEDRDAYSQVSNCLLTVLLIDGFAYWRFCLYPVFIVYEIGLRRISSTAIPLIQTQLQVWFVDNVQRGSHLPIFHHAGQKNWSCKGWTGNCSINGHRRWWPFVGFRDDGSRKDHYRFLRFIDTELARLCLGNRHNISSEDVTLLVQWTKYITKSRRGGGYQWENFSKHCSNSSRNIEAQRFRQIRPIVETCSSP